MSAIAVVREKETGSIANFRSTPITKFEFLLGKQVPYVAVAMVNFAFLLLMAIFVFGVPLKGPFLTLLIGTIVYVIRPPASGQLISFFTRTQVAAVFATAILSIVPAVNFSGLFAPVSSLSGTARILGLTFPSAWYQPITVGVFAKALGMSSLWFNVVANSSSSRSLIWFYRFCSFESRRRDVSSVQTPSPRTQPLPKLAETRAVASVITS